MDTHEAGLWSAYHATRSDSDRNELFEFYYAWIRGTVARLLVAREQMDHFEDILSEVCDRILVAIPRFNAERGIMPCAYLGLHLLGAVKDGFRLYDPISRHDRRRLAAVHEASRKLASTLQRRPTDAEVAEHLQWSEAEVIAASQPTRTEPLHPRHDSTGHHTPYSRFDDLLTGVSPKIQRIFYLRYVEGRSIPEIAKIFHRSESAVSRAIVRGQKFLKKKRQDSGEISDG